jgi:hypothetical protein
VSDLGRSLHIPECHLAIAVTHGQKVARKGYRQDPDAISQTVLVGGSNEIGDRFQGASVAEL